MASKMRPRFYALHSVTLDPATTVEDLASALMAADGVQDRHRLAEGAVYAAACRRYLMMTGRDWRSEGVTAATTAWGGESAHRVKIRHAAIAGVGLMLRWRCSCGEEGLVGMADHDGATAAHEAHVAASAEKLSPALL